MKVVRQKDPALKSAVELLATGQIPAAWPIVEPDNASRPVERRGSAERAKISFPASLDQPST
jgi:hypothetical protein